MVTASVFPYYVLLRRFRMAYSHMVKTRVSGFLCRPVKKGDIHHTVNYHSSAGFLLAQHRPDTPVPCPDKFPHRIKPSCQNVCRVESSAAGILISCLPVIGNRRGKEQKPDIMVKAFKGIQKTGQTLLHPFRRLFVNLIFRGRIHLPEHSGPESVRPETNTAGKGFRHIRISSVLRRIWDFCAYSPALRFHFYQQLLVNPLKPFSVCIA